MPVRNLAELAPSADAPVLVDRAPRGEQSWTGAQFSASIRAIAGALVAAGLQPGDAVLVAGGVSSSALGAFLGAAAAGMVAVPLNTKLPPATISFICRDASIRFALVERGYEPLVPAHIPAMSIDEAMGCESPARIRPLPHDHPLTIMYTSGSTGEPKGVPITHGGYIWAFERFAFLRPLIEGRTGLVAAPLFHMNGQFHALSMVFHGARVVLLERFSAAAFLDALIEHRVWRATGVPTMFALAVQEAGQSSSRAGQSSSRTRGSIPELGPRVRGDDLSHVGMVAMGSAPLTAALHDRVQRLFPNALVTNGYGTTESGPVSFGPHPAGHPTPPLALGYPMPGVELCLVGGPGPEEGRLLLRSPMTLRAYVNRPELSAAKIVDGWYDTGDLMRRDDAGFYYFVGRADDMMLVGGENVFPAEVERLLERHPDVAQAAVIAVPDEIKGEKPVAFVVLRAGAVFDEGVLKTFALTNGPAYAHPRRVIQLTELPLSAANKVDQAALRELLSTISS